MVHALYRWLFLRRTYVHENLRDASNREAVGVSILVLVLAISPIIIVLVQNAVATIQVFLSINLNLFSATFQKRGRKELFSTKNGKMYRKFGYVANQFR